MLRKVLTTDSMVMRYFKMTKKAAIPSDKKTQQILDSAVDRAVSSFVCKSFLVSSGWIIVLFSVEPPFVAAFAKLVMASLSVPIFF